MYLSTVLDDFSRYIIEWELYSTIPAGDVTDTLDMVLKYGASQRQSLRLTRWPRCFRPILPFHETRSSRFSVQLEVRRRPEEKHNATNFFVIGRVKRSRNQALTASNRAPEHRAMMQARMI